MYDMAYMALEAAKMNYFDVSVEFLTTLQELVKEKNQEMNEMKRKVKDMQIRLVNIHNNLLRKHKKTIGIDFRGKFFTRLKLG